MAASNCVLVERVRVRDAEVGLRRHQVHGRVGDVDRAVVDRHRAVGRRAALEHDAPRVGRAVGERLGVVHEQVGAAAVGHAVRHAVDRVPRLQLEALEDVGVVRDQVGVDRRHLAAGDQARRWRRRDADTPSYSPLCISCTISSRRVAELDVDLRSRSAPRTA